MEHSLLLNALVYLTAAVIAVPIAKRFGLGAVLGYLIAGICIGPWGLGFISEVEDILHFSEFGVVLLLFLIGLELDSKRLWAMRRQIFGWGSLQVGGTSLLLFALEQGLGLSWQASLIAALALSFSSTAIALATLGERNLNATPAGTTSFSILLFQDIAAIPSIAAVPVLGMAAAQSSNHGWLGALKAAGVILGLIFGGRYILRPILRAIAKTNMREIFTAFALLLVISIALLMQAVNMSMALGTFLAGVLLAESEYRHALESDLEPFKGLLLGLFFIAVGMSVDFGVLFQYPIQVLTGVIALLLIKISVLYLLSKCFKIQREQQLLFALLLAQGGEFAFVVFNAAVGAEVFSAQLASMLVLVVALSMVATPLLLLAYDKLIAPRYRNAVRPDDKIQEQDNPVVIAGFGRFGQIVGRLLFANRIGVTVLDHDPDQVDTLRKLGFKVFYGDATRIDLLRSAGVANAKILVVAIDNINDNLALIDAVKRDFPHLTILARARNVTHYYDLLDRGVTLIEREMFESALLLGKQVLEQLGYHPNRAHDIAMKFRTHNLQTLQAVYPHYKDQQQWMSIAKQARQELEEMFARDAQAIQAGELANDAKLVEEANS